MAFLKKDNENEKIYIYFISKEKFNKDDLKQRVKHSKDNGATNVIFVLHGSTNLNPSDETELNIEFFKEDDLLVNITQHELVPVHIPVSAQEKAELLKRYKVKEI
eukprot:CAMPEP_0114595368 /NCGR_PEP_ID=MMETSP0125-20121206/17150_1 /TAXON_ID=485358 ORGANISM="Aristerostoma sp., Strain ATCC 50986" /NCGR_SAMPLE_ID=MMETSP0125 /ASSEMBLY_ACC=CAM_ASM_000245 /LENGTH=104 /DNA_ID=CAMNT_0001796853 /DNA_START=89 /DNA_END=403 /DNA_ORIENTATION=-